MEDLQEWEKGMWQRKEKEKREKKGKKEAVGGRENKLRWWCVERKEGEIGRGGAGWSDMGWGWVGVRLG